MPTSIVGYDQIVGDDGDDDYDIAGDDDVDALLGDDYLVGAVSKALARRRTSNAPMIAQALLQRAKAIAQAAREVEGAQVVRTARPTEARDLVIGLVSLAVVAAATATVTARPQVLFRPKRLVIPSAIAPAFTIDDIKIGNKSQLVAAGSIPGEAFSQDAFGALLKMDTCQISMDLILSATNQSAATADFRAALFGDAVY